MTQPTTIDPLVVHWAGRLRAAVAPLERQLRQETAGPFTPTQLSVLGAVVRHGPLPLGELATRERLSSPTISKVVASLEDAGMVARQADADDRRVCRVEVTAKGNHWIDETRLRRNEWLAERIATLNAPERAALAAAVPVLERLLAENG